MAMQDAGNPHNLYRGTILDEESAEDWNHSGVRGISGFLQTRMGLATWR